MAKKTIAAYATWMKKLGKEFKPTIKKGLVAASGRVVNEMHRASDKAFDRGGYKSGWRAVVIGGNILRVYNLTKYAGVIELGRRPNRRPPPTSAIVPWVKRKLGVGKAEAQSVAYIVARSIGKKGIKGKFILKTARPNLVRIVKQEIMAALRAKLRETL